MENKIVDFKKEVLNNQKSQDKIKHVTEMFDTVVKMTKENFIETKELMPCVHLLLHDNQTDSFKAALFPMLAKNEEEKSIFANIVRGIIESFDKDESIEILGVITIFEAYVSKTAIDSTNRNKSVKEYIKENSLKPSEDPNRMEAISFTFEQEFTSRHMLFEFISSDDESDIVVQETPFMDQTIANDQDRAGGTFSFLFTKKRISEQQLN